ncbi:uncharacterized protein PG998_013938 [Apiospora kogelbergensis]|uniref:uncharacterized protein n=1 Tax=Apiospora kogelbergensis TaxID=1337665 RepID=UPI00312FB819
MAIFVDLDEEDEPTSPASHLNHNGGFHELPIATATTGPKPWARDPDGDNSNATFEGSLPTTSTSTPSQQPPPTMPTPTVSFSNGMTEALGCYPIAMAVASLLDLNALDNLSRTCRGVRQGLLQYRSSLVTHTLHCVNEDIVVDPEDTFRYRARAGNWFYMQEMGGDRYNGKSGSCARDMVAECRRCAKVNCAIKPPAPIVLRDRHRRLCIPCTKAPLGTLAKPPLLPETPLDADLMKNAICTCQNEGVWLCHPCGRSIRGTDHDYQSIWRWRNQYGEVLGGLGTGIGDGDRGVICGRDWECVASKEREQETDCDAEDARERSHCNTPLPWIATVTATSTTVSSSLPSSSSTASTSALRPPSSASTSSSGGGGGEVTGNVQQQPPQYSSSPLGPGYVRHEIEGIGGVVKTKRLTMVKVGACVPEWEDEKNRGEILGREVKGIARSWCGWCWRVIPGKKDVEDSSAARHSSGPSGTAISGEMVVR